MEEDLAEIEARMYAQVYHDTSVEPTPETAQALPHNLNKQSNKRYWQNSKNLSTQRQNFEQQPEQREQAITQPKTPIIPKPQAILTEETSSSTVKTVKTFVPYTSVLSFMGAPMETAPLAPEKPNNYEKKKNKSAKFPKKQLLNPLSKQGVTKGKSAMRLEVQQKKQKAALARKKHQNKVIDTIELEDSDESDCIPVELPPPPLISIDSSDDEETIKKKRAMSPSTSSIISDDFIVAGDKRRIANPFKAGDELKQRLSDIAQQKEALEKVKAMTKVSSTSSSDSARSSVERSVEKPAKKNKNHRNSEENEDSIYVVKSKAAKQSSEVDEAPTVNAKNQKVRRRKSTGSRKKSTESEKEEEVELKTSTPLAKLKKRSRIITETYDEDEFASMISTILNNDEEDSTDHVDEIMKEVMEEVTADDCQIIEKPVEIVTVPDEDPVVSDSDDSMKGVKLPVNCDLSLNVTETPYDPHEYIREGGENSHEVGAIPVDEVNPEIGWNDEMKFFYDGSWGSEQFGVSDIQEAMPRDPKLWRVNNSDRNRTFDSGNRMRCRNCNEIGHIAVKCTRPKKRIVCFMCGGEGHRETRCPNSICLRCGRPNKLFATICSSCHKQSKKYCPLCNYQGHDMEMCPDKWRRYHSTTTDTNELNSDFKVNPRVYCSICARKGHFAENCNQFMKTISGMITSSTIKITSHKPSYPRVYLTQFEDDSSPQQQKQVLALFTYFPFYKFNFQFSRIVRLYPRFIEQFEKHRESLAIAAAPAEKKSKKKSKKKQRIEESAVETTTHDDSNSNYSFSEFYQPKQPENVFKSPEDVNKNQETTFENAIKAVTESIAKKDDGKLVKNPFAEKLPDFIPLGNDENLPQPEPETVQRQVETVSEARLMMTNEHFKLLMQKKGQTFLSDLQNRLEIVAQFKWLNNANALVITGVPSNQTIFHGEVREYLFRLELAQYEKVLENSSNLPKNKIRIVHVMKENLQLMNRLKTFAVKNTLDMMVTAEKTMDFKKILKCRKALNIAFIGHAELCEGGMHVGALRRILYILEKEIASGKFEISADMREEISVHMKAIFSHHDYGDYKKLFSQYAKIMKQRQKNKGKLVMNPILN